MENIMNTMDAKSVEWVGDMYQKFEAMCVEVEETVYQESVKYVENQVKTVGACVTRFYSDVMQDLLPQSFDDSVDYADDTDVKRVQENSESGHLSSDPSDTEGNRLSSGLHKLPSDDSTAVKYLDFHEKQSGTEELGLTNSNNSELNFCSEITESEILGPQLDLLSKGDESTSALRKMSEGAAECLARSITSSSLSNPGVWEEFGNDEDNDKDMSKISDGSAGSYESDGYEFENNDYDKESFQVSAQLCKLKLEESCVLVDKYENLCASPTEGKQRSYKKKIRDVFYLRRWASSKKPEQLNVWKGNMDPSSNESKKITVSALNLQNSAESDWEIV